MLATLCQLLVVLFSLFRVVWDFLVGCLGFFTESSVLSSILWLDGFVEVASLCSPVRGLRGALSDCAFFTEVGWVDWEANSRESSAGWQWQVCEDHVRQFQTSTYKGEAPNLSVLQPEKTALRGICGQHPKKPFGNPEMPYFKLCWLEEVKRKSGQRMEGCRHSHFHQSTVLWSSSKLRVPLGCRLVHDLALAFWS